MLKHVIGIGAWLVFGSMLASGEAASADWGLDEVYSNADGSVQFILLNTVDSSRLAGQTLVASNGVQTHTFVFPSDLPGDAVNHLFLVATEGFQSLCPVSPDYVLPRGFLFLPNGSLRLGAADFNYAGLPTDGVNAVWQDPDGGPNAIVSARATNFAGESCYFASPLPSPAPSPPPALLPTPPPTPGLTTIPAVPTSTTPPTSLSAVGATIGPGFTGAWFDPAQSGHGLFVEVLDDSRFLAWWFTFNPEGTEQTWFGGVGNYSGNTATITDVYETTGGRWIPNFDSGRIANSQWGTLTFTFTDCDHGRVDFNSVAGYGGGSMNIARVTQPAGLKCP